VPDHAALFFTLSVLVLLTILLIFGMRTFAASRASRREDGQVRALTAEIAEVKTRLSAIETLLRTVE